MFKADGLTLVSDRPTQSLVWRFPDLFQLLLEIKLSDDTLVPGQPLELQWRLNERHVDGVVHARIFIDGHLVREHADVPIASAQSGTGWIDEQKITIQDAGVAAMIYRFGSRLVEIEVRSGDRLHRARRALTVVPDNFSLSLAQRESWWLWRGSSSQQYEWKESFELVGDFINRARFARISKVEVRLAAVLIDQTEPYVDPCSAAFDAPVAATATDIEPKASHTFRFPLYYDWEWLTPAVFVVGDVSKSYDYGVWVHATDQYGNVYQACTPIMHRIISVSEEKWAFGMSAMGLAATAAGLAIAAGGTSWTLVGGIAFGAAAAAAYAAAYAAAEKAYDPPEPDMRRFREPVEVKRPKLPEWPREQRVSELRAFRDLIERTLRVLALEDARTVTRARLMGARLGEDDESARMQERVYLELVNEMKDVVAPLEDIAERARQELEQHPAFEPDDWFAEIGTFAEVGFPPELETQLRKLGASGRALTGLRKAAESARLAELLEVNGLSLVQIASALQRVVRQIELRSENILAGEEYVAPPEGRTRLVIAQMNEAATRAGRAKCFCRK